MVKILDEFLVGVDIPNAVTGENQHLVGIFQPQYLRHIRLGRDELLGWGVTLYLFVIEVSKGPISTQNTKSIIQY